MDNLPPILNSLGKIKLKALGYLYRLSGRETTIRNLVQNDYKSEEQAIAIVDAYEAYIS